MSKELPAATQPSILAAWRVLSESTNQLEDNPNAFLFAVRQLASAIYAYYGSEKQACSADDIVACLDELNKANPMPVNQRQGQIINSMLDSFEHFTQLLDENESQLGPTGQYYHQQLLKEHGTPLNSELNNLILAILLPITGIVSIKNENPNESPEDKTFIYQLEPDERDDATGFAGDYFCKLDSEDCFIDAMKELVESLCEYLTKHPMETITHDRHQVIKKLLLKANELVDEPERHRTASERFKEMADLAKTLDVPKGELHKILERFQSKIPILSPPATYVQSTKTDTTINAEFRDAITEKVNSIKDESPGFFKKICNFLKSILPNWSKDLSSQCRPDIEISPDDNIDPPSMS